jgi:hypothetical protein
MDEAFVASDLNVSTGEEAYRLFDRDESLYRHSALAATLQTTDVALRRPKHTRQLLLRNPVRPSQ